MISDEEFISILSDYNFWVKKPYTGISREFYINKILKILNGINIVTESGLRRSEKSFISLQVALSFINKGINC